MSDIQNPAKKPKPDLLRYLLWGVALVGAAAVLYVIAVASFKHPGKADLHDLKTGALAKIEFPKSPGMAPTTPFTDGQGKPVALSDFRGQVVVLNLWATWCAPCKQEMPTLGKLQAAYAAQPVQVVAVSVDKPEDDNLVAEDIGKAPPLKIYRDPGYKLTFGIDPKPEGFPTTIVYDRKGVERARLAGGADWSSKEARELIDRLLAEKG